MAFCLILWTTQLSTDKKLLKIRDGTNNILHSSSSIRLAMKTDCEDYNLVTRVPVTLLVKVVEVNAVHCTGLSKESIITESVIPRRSTNWIRLTS